MSNCKRIITATGRSKHVEIFEAPRKIFDEEDETHKLRKLCSLPYHNLFYLRISSEQIFFKYEPFKKWCILDLQNSDIVKSYKPKHRI
jgi:hypothetical protein